MGVQTNHRTAERKKRSRPISEINVTPFVDVMLVLLIIFMVTAPLLAVGVPVDLPKTKASQISSEEPPLVISLRKYGKIYLQEVEIAPNQIVPRLAAIQKANPNLRIFVRGDKTINYGRVLEIMGMLSGSGFSKVALISEPYKER